MSDPPPPTVLLLGTCDTKLDELVYVHHRISNDHGVRVVLIDVGRTPETHPAIAITQSALFAASGLPRPADLLALPRGELISTLIAHAIPVVATLHRENQIHAALALGGSGGTSLGAEVMRAALPLGFPKLLVSTVAAGDVRAYVGESDLAMMHSVVDVAGLNDILCPVLENAAGAAAGMARAQHARLRAATPDPAAGPAPAPEERRRIAITMFGVTTPAVTRARALLAAYPCTTYVFHASGAGGRALERLAQARFWAGVLDLTTTELADALCGGVLSAGDTRLTAAAAARIPQIVSLGALDMVNFGTRDSVPGQYRGRRLFEHNPGMTLMRTTPEECRVLGRQLSERLRDADPALAEVWIPRGGVSALSVPGQPFHDAKADAELFKAVKEGLEGTVKVVDDERDVNDEGFVGGMVARLVQMMRMERIDETKGQSNGSQ
ncbi:UPF0261 domain protein [Amylocystis lapponica]|nr:UPF0261 domain protein [Amylocystis lapponica]